jgi:hypothetical protein
MTKAVMADFVVYAGPHPWQDAGWQIALRIGMVDVSIACTSSTEGVELMVWDLFVRPLVNVTPNVALNVLMRLAAMSGDHRQNLISKEVPDVYRAL